MPTVPVPPPRCLPVGPLRCWKRRNQTGVLGPGRNASLRPCQGTHLGRTATLPQAALPAPSFLKSQRKPTATSVLPFFPSPSPVTLQSGRWGQRQGSGPLPAFSSSFPLLCSGPRPPGPVLGVLPRDSASRTQGQGRHGPCPLGRLLPSTDIPIGWRPVRARG